MRAGENRRQWASEGRTKCQPRQVAEHRANVQCPVSAEGRRDKRGPGKLRFQGVWGKHSGTGANTIHLGGRSQARADRDTGWGTRNHPSREQGLRQL